jgi:CHAT domain-containing protein
MNMKNKEASDNSPKGFTRDGFDLSQVELENPLLELSGKTELPEGVTPLKISLSRGDLRFSSYPVLAGHFEDDGILYAEKTINRNLDGILSHRHQLGIYPGPIGSSEVFFAGKGAFKGAVIVGLGQPGNLTPSELTKTVEQGVANYLLKLGPLDPAKMTGESSDNMTGISSLVIGCGYAGLSIENSIKAIILGVYNANSKVRSLNLENSRLIGHLEFIELYEDKAASSLFSISRIQKEENNTFKIIKEGKGIKPLLGYRKRIPSDETEAWWNRISVLKVEDKEHKVVTDLLFKTSTRSSREEEQKLLTTPSLMEKLIGDISTSKQWTPERAKTIFELLIPNDFKDQLKRHGNIIWILDDYTASYPWELLQDNTRDTQPMCISSGMIRQLKTDNYRKSIKTVPKNNALVVADPDLEGFYNQLPGALREGKNVTEKLYNELKWTGGKVTASYGEKHSLILEKLFRDDYKIIHLSGHGVFNQDNPEQSGMVIGKDQFLSTREIKQMSASPEMVFVNCCHLGKSSGVAEELYQQRYQLAANIGTQLINNGVRCVIAAGWAVDDKAAEKFADVFYTRMFKGDTFGDAVLKARKAVYSEFSLTNTWGAYQCYGDPFYKFENVRGEKHDAEISYLIAEQARVDLFNLLQELEIGDHTSGEYLEKLGNISAAVDAAKIRNPEITEFEALICLELREYEKACDKFVDLLKMEEATFSFSVAEKYYNAQAKKIIEDYKKDPGKVESYIKKLEIVIDELNNLIRISPTSEKYNILASTYKRKACLIKEANEKFKGYENAAFYYQLAYSKFDKWYSLTNWLIIDGIFRLSGKRDWNKPVKTKSGSYTFPSSAEVFEKLELKKKTYSEDMEVLNYWQMIATINIKLCSYILGFSEKNNMDDLDKIIAEISALWEKAGSKGKRFAEIEHIEFIIDALSVEKNSYTELLRNNFIKMKDKLLSLA